MMRAIEIAAAFEAQKHDLQPSPDGVTVLRAQRGEVLTKRIAADGVHKARPATWFDAQEVVIADHQAMTALLTCLAPRRDLALVRAALVGGPKRYGIRRLLHDDRVKNEPATLVDVPRLWLALDVDDVSLPTDILQSDLEACAQQVRRILPREFHSARMFFTPSASHGVKPGIRLHGWARLDRAVTGAFAKRWLNGAPVDPQMLIANQLVITAAPILDGVADPLPHRNVVCLEGDDCVHVPRLPPERADRSFNRPMRPWRNPGFRRRYVENAVASACRIVAHAAETTRNRTLNAQAFSLARLVVSGDLAEADWRAALSMAARCAGLDDAEVEATLNSALQGARAKAVPLKARHSIDEEARARYREMCALEVTARG
jgi:hypothetical protein